MGEHEFFPSLILPGFWRKGQTCFDYLSFLKALNFRDNFWVNKDPFKKFLIYSLNNYPKSSHISCCSKCWCYTGKQDMVLLLRQFILVKIRPHLHHTWNGLAIASDTNVSEQLMQTREVIGSHNLASFLIARRDSSIARNLYPSLNSAFFYDTFILWKVFLV